MSRSTSNVDELRREIIEKINSSDHPATVVFNSHVTALAVVRSLGPRGIPIVALDRDNRGIAFHSRYTTVSSLCPYPLEDEGGFIEFLLDLGSAFDKKPVIMPCMDEWVWAVARHRDRLQRYYLVPIPEYDRIGSVLSKKNLYKKADKLGIPIPKTFFLDKEEVMQVANEITYPCILKPEYKREFYEEYHSSVMICGSRDQLVENAGKLEKFGVMAQEIIPISRGSLYTYGSYISPHGEVLGEFIGRRLEVFPIGFGTTCLVESRYVEEVRRNGFLPLKEAGYYGISEVEFIHDERDGLYKMLDVNTRPWKWIGLLTAAGVDLPWLCYSDALGQPVIQSRQFDGITWVYLYDYARLKAVRKKLDPDFRLNKSSLLALLKDLGDNVVAGDYAENDEGPFNFILENQAFWDGERAYYCPC